MPASANHFGSRDDQLRDSLDRILNKYKMHSGCVNHAHRISAIIAERQHKDCDRREFAIVAAVSGSLPGSDMTMYSHHRKASF
jgi:hypothetical protein